MSIVGLLSSSFLNFGSQVQNTNVPAQTQQFQQEFQQLGQDLQSGNLSAAQTDFTTLQQNSPVSSSSTAQTPISQAFGQLSQDLQSGNVSAAQQAYASIQQDMQTQGSHMRHHHHHGGGEATNSTSQQQNPMAQLFSELGQDLQSGNVSAAQQAYSSMQQDFSQFALDMSSAGATTSTVSATA
jgi:outer membrane protein assembly factor BamD (BamD/ComL family)